MSAQLDKILKYFKTFPDVWFARHDDIVTWFLGQKVDVISPKQRFFGE
jgi:hypothetical protein